MSLLREIQNDIADRGGDVASILRKCKILAARLGSAEFSQWVGWELGGYPGSQPTPEYRKLHSTCYANFINIAWRANRQAIPQHLVPEKHREILWHPECREGVAAVTSFVGKGAIIARPELAILLQGKMFPEMECVSAWSEISGSEFEQLVSAVKSRILDFVLEIEAANPNAGEAPLNSHPVPEEKLHPLVNNFFAQVGNVAQNASHFHQSNLSFKSEDLARLVSEFTQHIAELSLNPQQRKKAEAQIATIKAQLEDEPDPVIIRQAGCTLRNVTEGAIGSLLASATQPTVWHWVHRMPELLTK
jgi:hypothetical protein